MSLEDDDRGADLVGEIEELASGCDIGAKAKIRGLEVHKLVEVSAKRMRGCLGSTGEGRLEGRVRRHDAAEVWRSDQTSMANIKGGCEMVMVCEGNI
jgi:hypothetical protein